MDTSEKRFEQDIETYLLSEETNYFAYLLCCDNGIN